MTSKVSFFKMVKSECTRRLWLLTILAVLFAGALPVAGLMQLQRYDPSGYEIIEEEAAPSAAANAREERRIQEIRESMEEIVGKNNSAVSCITLAGAFLAGISGFAYLHSRKKTDLFHSIPVRRERLFLVQQASGFILYLLPLLGAYLLALLVGAIKGALWAGTWLAALKGLAFQILSFFLAYETVVLGMMLTGKLLVAVLGIVVLFGYFPATAAILDTYMNFFRTYIGSGKLLWRWLEYLTPLYPLYWADQTDGSAWALLVFLLAGALLMGASLLLYRIRRTEAAEQSMAFPRSQAVIKWLLVLPLSLAGGIIMSQVAMREDSLWMFFGILVGVVLISGIVEVVYSYDFRRAFSHRIQMLLMAVLALGVGSIFRFDLLGYDTWLPREDQVESMAVSSWRWTSDNSYWEAEGNDFRYQDRSEYLLEHMKITDFEGLYQMAREGAESTRSEYGNSGDKSYICIRYNLKNGSAAERQYEVSDETLDAAMEQLVCTREYQEAAYQLLTLDPQIYREMSVRDRFDKRMAYEEEQELIQEVVEAYREDLRAQELESWKRAEFLGILNLTAGREAWKAEWAYPIDSTFTHTLEVLENRGIQLLPLSQESVSQIRVIDYASNEELVISSPEEIQELLPLLEQERNGWGGYEIQQENLGFRVIREEENQEVYAYLKEGAQLPEFLAVRLDKN